ncbi:MAG TPA: methyltransferase domain-containing protein [Acidobacteriaceae bacterium]|jgi:SAM-dependent methyltransferase
MTGTSRTCAVCGGNQKRSLFQQTFSTVCLLEGYTVAVCEGCGFCFADDIPEQEAFDAYYRDLSKYEYQHRGGRESANDETRLRDVAATLRQVIPSQDTRVLEIGCSTGRLLALLKESGYRNVWGLDPSPVCAASARDLYDVTVMTQSLSDLAQSDEKFDFLILVGVLEHIRDLDGALDTLRKILTPNARIYFDVPDATQFADWPDAPYQQFSMEHINFFSGASLANLMRTRGFEPVFSEKVLRQYTDVTVMPSVHAVFEDRGAPAGAIVRDEESEQRLLEYIADSRTVDGRIRELIDRTAGDREPILVWGVGTHTQRLLATGGLDKVNVSAFIDSNPKYHGKRLHDIPIISPDTLGGRSEPILICSRVFQKEIEEQIHERLQLNNEVLSLYAV